MPEAEETVTRQRGARVAAPRCRPRARVSPLEAVACDAPSARVDARPLGSRRRPPRSRAPPLCSAHRPSRGKRHPSVFTSYGTPRRPTCRAFHRAPSKRPNDESVRDPVRFDGIRHASPRRGCCRARGGARHRRRDTRVASPSGPARRLGCPVAVRRDAAFADAGRARVGADGLPATPLRGRVFAGDPRLADFHHHARARRAPGRDRAAQGRSAPVAGRRSPRSSRDGVDEQRALARRARGRRLGTSAFASRGDCVAHVRARGRGLGRGTQGDGLRRARRRGNERRRDGGTSGAASASARRPRG